MRTLFARIGYMKFYQGPQKGDEKPIGGGKYNKNQIGSEAYNFKEVNGKVYGYFQPHMKEPYRINLRRIDPKLKGESVADDVLVIFFSKNPVGKGQVIVGWYKRATVHEDILSPKDQKQRKNYEYNIEASHADSLLLPINKRKFLIGHGKQGVKEGNPGQANAFYVFDNKCRKKPSDRHNAWINNAIKYVNSYDGPSIKSFEDEVSEEVDNSTFGESGQGFQPNLKKKTAVEKYAMDRCRKHFVKEGYSVTDVSLLKPYDYEINKKAERLLIEVKGTQTDGTKIILTRNEVEMSRNNGGKMMLFVVHSVEMINDSVKRGSGQVVILNPWEINNNKLIPVSYTYQLS